MKKNKEFKRYIDLATRMLAKELISQEEAAEAIYEKYKSVAFDIGWIFFVLGALTMGTILGLAL